MLSCHHAAPCHARRRHLRYAIAYALEMLCRFSLLYYAAICFYLRAIIADIYVRYLSIRFDDAIYALPSTFFATPCRRCLFSLPYFAAFAAMMPRPRRYFAITTL